MEFTEIGNVKIEKTAALAPMASVADRAYRDMCKAYGAAYTVSEMISAKGLCYGDRKTEELCSFSESDRPFGMQIFGEDPDFCGKAAGMLMKYKPDILDINMGCPVPKITSNGSGSALMKDPDRAYAIVRAAVSSSDVPVTVKIRSGWDSSSVNAPEFARAMESAGAAAVTVHGRTKSQMYGGKADWDIIRRVKEAVKIPVIGSGDVVSPQTAEEMYRQTGCDLVMIGRGSYGRPWIFSQVKRYLEDGAAENEPDVIKRLDVMMKQAELTVKYKGERTAFAELRRQCAFYLRGIPRAAEYRKRCGELSSMEDLRLIRREVGRGSVNIRPARETDLERFAELERENFSQPWSIDSLRREFFSDESLFIAAEEAVTGLVCGYLTARTVLDEVYVYNLAVCEDYRRLGIGKGLMERLIFRVEDKASFISLEVRESNSAAIRLYEGLGFEKTGRRERFYRAPEEAALLMTKFFKGKK